MIEPEAICRGPVFLVRKMVAAAFKLFLSICVFMCAIQMLCSIFSRLSGLDIAVVLATWYSPEHRNLQ